MLEWNMRGMVQNEQQALFIWMLLSTPSQLWFLVSYLSGRLSTASLSVALSLP